LAVTRSRSLIVAGAGIGGLSAAIALSKADYRVLVLERAAALGETGAGLQLTPNATRALRELGVLEKIRPLAIAPQALAICDARRGHEIVRADLRGIEERYGSPWLTIARSDLHRVLVETAADHPDVEIKTGMEAVDFADHSRGVTVSVRHGQDSREEMGAALIGADGLRSNIRARLHGKTPPRFQKVSAWRASVPAKLLPDALTEPAVRLWFAQTGHVIHYPIAGGERINLVLIFADERGGKDGEELSAKDLPPECERWAEPLQNLLKAAPSFRRWPLYDRPSLPAWGKGHATLLGDAAHPMLPFAAQGAAAAIEDAVVLARHLKGAEDLAPRLRAYEKARASRTARMQTLAIENGRAYHVSPIKRIVRDLLLPRMGARLISRGDWIYKYRA
jgi:salicylate hydroxylase